MATMSAPPAQPFRTTQWLLPVTRPLETSGHLAPRRLARARRCSPAAQNLGNGAPGPGSLVYVAVVADAVSSLPLDGYWLAADALRPTLDRNRAAA
jgi:hypothetical protein